MGSNWEAIGFTRWPMSFCFVLLAILGLWSAFKLFRPGASPDLRTKAWLDGVLVWGFLAFLIGLLGGVEHEQPRSPCRSRADVLILG